MVYVFSSECKIVYICQRIGMVSFEFGYVCFYHLVRVIQSTRPIQACWAVSRAFQTGQGPIQPQGEVMPGKQPKTRPGTVLRRQYDRVGSTRPQS